MTSSNATAIMAKRIVKELRAEIVKEYPRSNAPYVRGMKDALDELVRRIEKELLA